MKIRSLLIVLSFLFAIQYNVAQVNLALSATVSVKDTVVNAEPNYFNDGSYGISVPYGSAYVDSISFTTWIKFEWPNAMAINRVSLIIPMDSNTNFWLQEVSSVFYLQYWSANAWHDIDTIFSFSMNSFNLREINFPQISTTKIRLFFDTYNQSGNTSFDEILVFNDPNPNRDLAINRVISPPDTVQLGVHYPIQVEVKNRGATVIPITYLSFEYFSAGLGSSNAHRDYDSLYPGDSMVISFVNDYYVYGGGYTALKLLSIVDLDSNLSNNTLDYMVYCATGYDAALLNYLNMDTLIYQPSMVVKIRAAMKRPFDDSSSFYIMTRMDTNFFSSYSTPMMSDGDTLSFFVTQLNGLSKGWHYLNSVVHFPIDDNAANDSLKLHFYYMDTTSSVTSVSSDINVRIWPNPSVNSVNIQITDYQKDYTCALYNSSGKLVYNSPKNIQKIDLLNYKSGIYYLYIQFDKELIIRKIVKL